MFFVKSSVWSSVFTGIFRDARSESECHERCPDRISPRIWESSSEVCLYCSERIHGTIRAHFHTSWEKAKSSLATGGSWKKSPTKTICIPPNGKSDFFVCLSIRWRESRKSPDNIEISSIIKICVFWNRFTRYSRSKRVSISSSERISLTPIPDHEWIVIPQIWVAAIPVEAVTATDNPCSWQ